MKKIIALALTICIASVSLTACSSEEIAKEAAVDSYSLPKGESYTDIKSNEFVPCAQSGDLSLSFQPSTTQLKVENSKDGSVWYSNPQNASEDINAKQLVKLRMMSTLEIEYTNLSTKKRTTINNYTSNVKSGKYEISMIENGVIFKYPFTEVGKNVFLAVYFEKGALLTRFWYEDFDEKKPDVEISAVSVLPYLVRGFMGEEGYLFLPDGSGATVDFSNIVYSGNAYARNIYGYEPTLITSDYYLDVNKNSVYLPVYGAKVGESAVMAICEKGAEYGVLTAEACGQTSSYARAYVSYKLLNSIEYKVGNTTTELFDKVGSSLDYITTRYIFLDGEDADYSGMARAYRDYLIGDLQLKDTATALYTDIYASVIKKASTVGVPHNKTVSLTDAAELEGIIERLNAEGIEDITVRYRLWNSDEIKGKKIKSANSAAGISFKAIKNIKNAEIYPAVLSLHTYSNGSYFDRLINAAKSITQLPFSWKKHKLSNLNETGEAEYRVSIDWFCKNSDKLIERLKSKGISKLALGDVANSLYCDFKGEGAKRDKTRLVMSEFIKQSDEAFEGLMLDAANAYAAPFADIIYNAPVCHSNHDILCKSVPFYTMVMSGIADCVAPAYNSGVADNALLNTVASGAGFCVAWMSAEMTELSGTQLSGLSNVNFAQTVDDTVSLYKKVDAVYSKINGSRIYAHNYINDSVSLTEYENGLQIYVNFGKEPFVLEDGTQIPAESFTAREGEGQ
ncbi:MAG: hypothetical protein IKD04_00580 [Clostridia bacterium]|nr:hypothetical protein [Clostridia bacterium]